MTLRERAIKVGLEATKRGLWDFSLAEELVTRVEKGQTTEEELRHWEKQLERRDL